MGSEMCIRDRSNRLLAILRSEDEEEDDFSENLLRAITTDSYEVPTLIQEFMTVIDGTGSIQSSGLETLTTKLYHILNAPNSNMVPTTVPNTELFLGAREIGADPDPAMKHDVIMRHLTGFFANDEGNFRVDVDQLPNFGRRALLSNDIRSGRPFDINRPFGNGEDDNNNGVVDEPNQNNEDDDLSHPGGGNNRFDHDQDGVPSDNGEFGRQLFARQLYILTLLVTEMVDRNGDGQLFIPEDDGTASIPPRFVSKLDPEDFPDFNGLNDVQSRRAYRKMVAQWAINVADFRDADSIHTGFEVDLNPFDGWDVNGDMMPDERAALGLDYFRTHGAERPELLISESIHLHDRREEDLSDSDIAGAGEMTEDGEDMGDPDFDSRLAPNASGFFELYHPWVTSETNGNLPNQFLPAELGENGVDLQQMTDNGAPVWRIVVANNGSFEFRFVNANTGERSFESLFGNGGYSFLNDPDQDFLDDGTMGLPTSAIRRYVYFANPNNSNSVFTGDKAFAPPSNDGPAVIRPGGFAVLGSAGFGNNSGPDFTTYLGRRVGVKEGDLLLDETRRMVLNPNDDTVTYYPGNDLNNEIERDIDVVLPLVSVNDGVRSYGATDPDRGYKNQAETIVARPYTNGDALRFEDETGQPVAVDSPADLDTQFRPTTDLNFVTEVLRRDQLSNGIFVLLLQRVANPLKDWDPNTNPYVTIDSSGGDVFSFNGAARQLPGTGAGEDPTVMGPEDALDRVFRFSTFERQANDASTSRGVDPSDRNLWRPDYRGLDAESVMDLPSDMTHVLDFELANTFGSMNASYLEPGGFRHVTQIPFSWLAWNNRPFNSAMELTNVPYTSSFFLTNRFNVSIRNQNESTRDQIDFAGNLYDLLDVAGMPPAQQELSRVTAFSGEFPHLLNFHADARESFQLSRLMDYVEVPSRYVGTETYVNPNVFTRTGDASDLLSSVSMSFAPPFDYVSNYRVPGKVNVNTVTRESVWNAVMRRDQFNSDASVNDQVSLNEWTMSRGGDDWDDPYRYAAALRWQGKSNTPGRALNVGDAGLFRRGAENNVAMFDYMPLRIIYKMCPGMPISEILNVKGLPIKLPFGPACSRSG